MAVTYANIIRNHRGVYFEATGDGVTTALTVNHLNGVHAGTTGVGTVTTAPGNIERKSGCGGFHFPVSGTPVTVSSTTVTATAVTINTSAAVGNGTKAYCVVVFDQPSATL